jgi:dimethylargininase
MRLMWTALTRAVSPTLGNCELTHLARSPIDVKLAAAQHEDYEAALVALGCRIERLPELPEQPDAVFVEDTALVLDEIAVVTRPGAPGRRPETASVATALGLVRNVVELTAPATLDGGDVVQVGRRIFVGCSGRTNAEGVSQLQALVSAAGYEVRSVEMDGCLHLKSAVTCVAPGTLLLNPDWVDVSAFADLDCLQIDPSEPFAANAVRVGDRLLHAEAFPRTRARLTERGLDVRSVDMSELAKAEGALTCCSLLVRQ